MKFFGPWLTFSAVALYLISERAYAMDMAWAFAFLGWLYLYRKI